MRFNKPKTLTQHLVYWPFMLLAVFFIYLDFSVIYHYIFRKSVADTLFSTILLLIILTILAWVFSAISLAAVGPKRSPSVPIKKKNFGPFSDIKFIVSATPLKLGEKFFVRLTGLDNELLNKQKLVLWLYLNESTEYEYGGGYGYNLDNYFYEYKHHLTGNDLSGGSIELVIPTHLCPTLPRICDVQAHWFLRVEFLGRDLDHCHMEQGVTYQEIIVVPELTEGAEFIIPESTLQKIDFKEVWIELDGMPTANNQSLVVEFGDKITGRLVVLDNKRTTRARKRSIELCFFTYEDRWEITKEYKVKVPHLAIGERFEYPFEFSIPNDAPISVYGGDFEISWCIRSRTFFEWLLTLTSPQSPFVVAPLRYLPKRTEGE